MAFYIKFFLKNLCIVRSTRQDKAISISISSSSSKMGESTEPNVSASSEQVSAAPGSDVVTKLYKYDCPAGCCQSRYARFSTQAAEQEDLEAAVLSEPIIHRHVFSDTVWNTESFTVNDVDMQSILREALHKYQDFDPELEEWTFREPYSPIVHRWSKLNEILDKAQESGGKTTAIRDLMAFLRPILAPSIEALAKTKETGKVLFEDVWQIYPPGEVAMTSFYGIEAAARVVQYEKKYTAQGRSWEVELEYVDWNGDHCGFATTTVNIRKFSGYKFVTSLAAYPLSFCADEQQIKDRLISRGRQFESLRGYHFKTCAGTKILLETLEREERPVKGRVIIDSFAYYSSNNIVKPALRSLEDDADDWPEEESETTSLADGSSQHTPFVARRKQRSNSPDEFDSPAPTLRALPQYPGQPRSAWAMVDPTSGLEGETEGDLYGIPDEDLPATENSDGALMTAVTPRDKHSRQENLESLTNYQCLLTTPWLRGLDLKTKDWGKYTQL